MWFNNKSAEGDWSVSQEMFVLNSVNPYLLFCLILVSYIEEMHLAVMCPSNFFSIIYSGHGFDGFKCCVFGYIYKTVPLQGIYMHA